MVPKQYSVCAWGIHSFRAVLFRMVPKLPANFTNTVNGFRAVLFRMVPKHNTF
ncbi:hypothetical protein HMPREF0813_01259 [Streptococcus anginosus F0211]|uniref:Uncharacterized protein n=1 Tax=Streptococcus anginosus F0211 TaxID=706437 RepID=E6J1X1_STRAP|nr:hypothetical protein HMPREF0813_01259 [Streptococcus anginosus F0211]